MSRIGGQRECGFVRERADDGDGDAAFTCSPARVSPYVREEKGSTTLAIQTMSRAANERDVCHCCVTRMLGQGTYYLGAQPVNLTSTGVKSYDIESHCHYPTTTVMS